MSSTDSMTPYVYLCGIIKICTVPHIKHIGCAPCCPVRFSPLSPNWVHQPIIATCPSFLTFLPPSLLSTLVPSSPPADYILGSVPDGIIIWWKTVIFARFFGFSSLCATLSAETHNKKTQVLDYFQTKFWISFGPSSDQINWQKEYKEVETCPSVSSTGSPPPNPAPLLFQTRGKKRRGGLFDMLVLSLTLPSFLSGSRGLRIVPFIFQSSRNTATPPWPMEESLSLSGLCAVGFGFLRRKRPNLRSKPRKMIRFSHSDLHKTLLRPVRWSEDLCPL